MKKWHGNRGRIPVDGGGGLLIYRTIVLFGYVHPGTNYVTVRMYASLYARTPHSVSESGKVLRAGPAVSPTLPLPCGRRQLPGQEGPRIFQCVDRRPSKTRFAFCTQKNQARVSTSCAAEHCYRVWLENSE